MISKRLFLLLISVIILSIGSIWWGKKESTERETVEPISKTVTASPSNALPSVAPKLRFPERQVATPPNVDLFAGKSWYVPPPPPKAAPPVAPTPPPLPFSYMGKMQDEASTIVFLTSNGKNYIVKTGELINSTYKVENITDQAMTLLYLPLNMKQTLVLRGHN